MLSDNEIFSNYVLFGFILDIDETIFIFQYKQNIKCDRMTLF
jgi:hypothetical protein